jgi:hypothetical protein
MTLESSNGQVSEANQPPVDFSYLRPTTIDFLIDVTQSGAFDALDETKRNFIAKYALENTTYKIIGEQLNLPSNTVRWHVRTGLQKAWEYLPDDLREKYDPEDVVVVKKRSSFYSEERKRKIGEANRVSAKHHGVLSDEHKQNIGKGRKGKKFGPMSQEGRENIRNGMLAFRQQQRLLLVDQEVVLESTE